MEFVIDGKSFKFQRFLRISFFILISLVTIALIIASFYALSSIIIVPIIITLLLLLLNTLFIFVLLVFPENNKDKVYNLNDNVLSFGGNNINLNQIDTFDVYSIKDKVYKIKIKTNIESYTIYKLNNNGLNAIINNILEVKNGKDI